MTPGYAAPEQIKNEKRSISPRTDFFAWGVVMYEMLAGFNPFNKGCSNLGQVLQNTLSLEPPPLDKCHSSIRSVTEWCLKKQLHRRPATAELILERLKEIGI
jgi:serine/threonine-protein kinase